MSVDSKDFGVLSSAPKLPQDPNDPAPQVIVYSLCPPEAYYLTYVDGRGVLGTLSEAVTKSGTGVLETAQKTAINSAASAVFVLHAKLVALTINVMLWAFDFDAVAMFGGPVKDLTQLLGEKVYEVLLPVVWVMAVGYAAWVSIGRGEVALDQAAGDNSLLPPPAEDTGPHAQDPLSSISRSMWLTYVETPWSKLQISADNAGADEDGRNGAADEHAPDLLRIRHPDDRARYLCDLAGADCGGWFGEGAGGDEPEETTGGGTTTEGGSTR